jgi:hypothetical protein
VVALTITDGRIVEPRECRAQQNQLENVRRFDVIDDCLLADRKGQREYLERRTAARPHPDSSFLV